MSQSAVETPSLYERLGAENAIRAAVDEFYVRVVADPLLAGYFASTDMATLRRHQVAMLSQATGGPRAYTGAEMGTAHAGLAITDAAFTAVVGHLVATLQHLGVQQQEVDEVVAALAPLRSALVTA
jgi:hemoglobin